MINLELKIPPLFLTIVLAAIMGLISQAFPTPELPRHFALPLVTLFSLSGTLFMLAGVWSFRKAETTANPMRPESASSLVQTGAYKVSRNPMYLGFFLILVALGLFLPSLYSLLVAFGFVFYMNRYQIAPEEKALLKTFGAEFESYKQRVRRWI